MHLDNAKIEDERDRLLEQIRGLEETLEDHDRMREQVGSHSDILKERILQQEQARNLDGRVKECDRLQQEVRYLQDVAKERDQLQEDLVRMTEERNSLQKPAGGIKGRSKAAPGLDKGMQRKEAEPETEVEEDPKQQSQPGASRLRYCNVCLKSVDKIRADVRLCPSNSGSLLISAKGQS